MALIEVLPYDSISRSIAARHLMTRMEGATTVPVDATPEEVVRTLRPRKFDQAPVMSASVVVGVVTLEDAIEAEHDVRALPVQPLASRLLINADASIGALLRRLAAVPMVFAVEDEGLVGFVTPSDVNKHPARSHFYLLLADFEMTMAALARAHLSDPAEALAMLEPKRRKPIEKRYESNRSYNVDADVLTAFEFADLIAVTTDTGLFRNFGLTRAEWVKAVGPLPRFRNDVMHPTREFLGTRTITDLVETERHLRQMLTDSRSVAAA